ncbi:hypothetical protein [Paraburkholderia ferrariae]|jgi:hypothetical protein|uniref:hypothetical protein n=1 Tax=Paraburkholderia ferrariae TaxID=386056 RepID=UPI000A722358|nr:hypothetical protein [Paraburkholderia ferrariae]
MRETVAAYLLGPAVMLLVCAATWVLSHRYGAALEERLTRWLDAHRGHGMRHKH